MLGIVVVMRDLTYDTEELHRHVREASEVLCRCLVNFPKCLIKTTTSKASYSRPSLG